MQVTELFYKGKIYKEIFLGNSPGDPVVGTLGFPAGALGLIPGLGARIPQVECRNKNFFKIVFQIFNLQR